MLTVYVLLLIALFIICKIFHKTFFNNTKIGSDNYTLDSYVEPITRVFNALKYKDYNEKYNVKLN